MSKKKVKSWSKKRAVAAHYNCSTRTIDRWVQAGRFPKPIRLPNGHDYWTDGMIEEHDQRLLSNGKAAA
jgi:predicted DNA-binding transcriptional regulator AlpA